MSTVGVPCFRKKNNNKLFLTKLSGKIAIAVSTPAFIEFICYFQKALYIVNGYHNSVSNNIGSITSSDSHQYVWELSTVINRRQLIVKFA